MPTHADVKNESGFSHPFFKGVSIHDPMECFMTRAVTLEKVVIMWTHDIEDGELQEHDVLENETTIPYEQYRKEVFGE